MWCRFKSSYVILCTVQQTSNHCQVKKNRKWYFDWCQFKLFILLNCTEDRTCQNKIKTGLKNYFNHDLNISLKYILKWLTFIDRTISIGLFSPNQELCCMEVPVLCSFIVLLLTYFHYVSALFQDIVALFLSSGFSPKTNDYLISSEAPS